MSAIGDAQLRTLRDAEEDFIAARSALDQAKGTAENLHDAHPQLLDDETFWESIGAIDGMSGVLDDLITALGLDERP